MEFLRINVIIKLKFYLDLVEAFYEFPPRNFKEAYSRRFL